MADERLSARNPKVQRLRRLLGRRSARLDDGAFVVEGPTLVLDVLASDAAVEAVFLEAPDPALLAAARARQVPVHLMADGVIAKVSSTVTPQPALAVVAIPASPSLAEAAGGGVVLVLDAVADPGNAGTLLRTAEAAGVAAVVFAGEAVDPYNAKVVRASAGSLFRLPALVERDADAALAALGDAGYRRVGAAAGGAVPYDEADLTGPVALVLGNEAHGLRTDAVDEWVAIPMAGATESLNVAMAGTILCFEAARQRRAPERARRSV